MENDDDDDLKFDGASWVISNGRSQRREREEEAGGGARDALKTRTNTSESGGKKTIRKQPVSNNGI
eukprot:1576615-Karenia_brevis.AAC.1